MKWSFEIMRTTRASAEAIWNLWADVPHWNTWDSSVKHARLDGVFQVGATGILKPINGPSSRFMIRECAVHRRFVSETKLPLCRMAFVHELEQRDDALHVCHRIEMRGPLTVIFSRLIGRALANDLPRALDTLIEKAEQYEIKN